MPTIENTGLRLTPNSAYMPQPAPHSAFFIFCSCMAELATKSGDLGEEKRRE